MSGESPEPDEERGHNNALVAIVVLVILAIAWFLIHEYTANQQMENCRIEGRRDCAPIAMPPRQ